MKAYTQLTDDVFHNILYTPLESIALPSSGTEEADGSIQELLDRNKRDFIEAQTLLRDILNRKLLKYVVGTQQKVFLLSSLILMTFAQVMIIHSLSLLIIVLEMFRYSFPLFYRKTAFKKAIVGKRSTMYNIRY